MSDTVTNFIQQSNGADTYIEGGIVFFVVPFKTDITDWTFTHIDCDSIYQEDEPHSETVSILCYASEKQYNYDLYKIWKEKYTEAKLNSGVSSEEVNSFDRFTCR